MLLHDKIHPYAGCDLIEAFVESIITLVLLRHPFTEESIAVFV